MQGIKLAVAGVFAASAVAANAATYVLHAPAWGAKQEAAVAKAGGTVTFSHDGAGVAIVESGNPGFLAAALAGGAITGGAEDVVVAWTDPTMPAEAFPDAINPSDDRYFSTIQWAPQAVEAPAAWAMGFTGRGVRVAIIDGGIFNAHPDLGANVDAGASRSFVAPDPAASAATNLCRTSFNCDTGTLWHGTHVAGIVAAVDNSIGVVGIAPEATIVGVKALHSGSGSFGAVIQALVYASTDGRADVINMSLGARFDRGSRDAAELTSALNRAVNFATRNGSLVVVSAGNDGLDMDQRGSETVTPAESGNAVAVSATGPLGFAYGSTDFSRPASYSNYGNSLVWVSAPGGDAAYEGNENCTLPTTTAPVTIPCWAFDMVLSTSRGPAASAGAYTWTAGTSMAAPAATAVAALIKQKNPGISVGELKNRLAQSAADAGKVGQDNFHGRGFVNARNAVMQ